MEYEGPHHARLTRKLRRIAKEFGVKLWFKKDLNISGEYSIGENLLIVSLDRPSRVVTSSFFHELGHHLDYKDGIYRKFYSGTLSDMRRLALRAERHTDMRGKKLCKRYFPKMKWHYAYRSREDLEYLVEYYADGRWSKNRLTAMLKKVRVRRG